MDWYLAQVKSASERHEEDREKLREMFKRDLEWETRFWKDRLESSRGDVATLRSTLQHQLEVARRRANVVPSLLARCEEAALQPSTDSSSL